MTTTIHASEFIDDSLRLYSAQSNVRGIPFIGDGMKQSHRKAVYGMLLRGDSADKDTVERIAAKTCSDTDYAHGTSSMEGTISKLAQGFAGTNNMPLFEAHGQFGNRLRHEASASRYIKTKMGVNFRKLFLKEDDILFEHAISNDMEVEPRCFFPILPVILINGAEGMGTGHSCFILQYSPNDIKEALVKLLDGKPVKPNTLLPSYNDFSGTVYRNPEKPDQVVIEGKYEIVKRGRHHFIHVTELPVGVQLNKFKTLLDSLEEKEVILDYVNTSDKNGFDFLIKVKEEFLNKTDDEIKKTFNLISRNTENFTAWNSEGALQRFENAEALLVNWAKWRIKQVEKRRVAQISKKESDAAKLNERFRFIMFYLNNVDFFRTTEHKAILARLEEEGFIEGPAHLEMPIRVLTKQRMSELQEQEQKLLKEIEELKATNAVKMYKQDLRSLKC